MNRTINVIGLFAIALTGCASVPPSPEMEALKQQEQQAAMQKKMALQVGADGSVTASSSAPLVFCLPPVQDPDGSQRPLDLGGGGDVTEIPSRAAAAGCDVILQFAQHSGTSDFKYEASSAYSGAVLASGGVTNWVGVTNMTRKLVGELRGRLAPGTPGHGQLVAERRRTTGVGQRNMQYAAPDRQQQIDAAEREGDAASAAGRARDAFAAYTRALTGPWSDDPASQRVRGKYARLIGAHPEVQPPIPEEARRHMVRAQAVLKDSSDFGAYDQALGEMAAAAGAAPWWSDCYFNAALVAEKAGYLTDAIGALKFYVTANPRAPDARDVQDKIYALEIKAERAGRN